MGNAQSQQQFRDLAAGVFAKYDTDRSGAVDGDELVFLLRDMGMEISKSDARELIVEFDEVRRLVGWLVGWLVGRAVASWLDLGVWWREGERRRG